ncbi:MAG: hypothetical protein CMJ30_02145 [Phycisphaerae bacterium]|nr:hypothetical protein [Phycisphaerae bacterium]
MTEDGTESDGDMTPEPVPLTPVDVGCFIVLIPVLLIIGPLMIYVTLYADWSEYARIYQGTRRSPTGFISEIVFVLIGAFLSVSGIQLLAGFISELANHFRSKEKDDDDDRRESKEEQ